MFRLHRVQGLGTRLIVLSTASAAMWLLGNEALRGMARVFRHILAKVL